MGKVLIIDDEKQILGLLSRIIGLEGYEVLQAATCKAGGATFAGGGIVRCVLAGW